jgi:hypothetical protein
MFLLALQLKGAFRAKHKAKLAESKASFTKRRFANYIFHEVRVPLNNAGRSPPIFYFTQRLMTAIQCLPSSSFSLGTRSGKITPRARKSMRWSRA